MSEQEIPDMNNPPKKTSLSTRNYELAEYESKQKAEKYKDELPPIAEH